MTNKNSLEKRSHHLGKTMPDQNHPFLKAKSIGPKMVRYLEMVGISRFVDLLGLSPQDIALRINVELGERHINQQGVRALENLCALAYEMSKPSLEKLHARIQNCQICADLPLGPRPVLQPSSGAKILIAGQAPGRLVHETGVPFNDPSGERLRDWLGVTREQFYDPALFAIIPMGFCYPGTGKSGDLPPRPECRATWHNPLFDLMPQIELKIIIGAYALDYHLGQRQSKTLTETVKRWREFMPDFLPLPHPSPRNNIWLKRNPWFEQEVVPELRGRVASLIDTPNTGEEK